MERGLGALTESGANPASSRGQVAVPSIHFTKTAGFPQPVAFTIQAVLQDGNAANPSGLSVTNPIVLKIP